MVKNLPKGHETPTDWIFSMDWVKKTADYFNIDINHHLEVDENTKLPLPIRVIEWFGFETDPYFHTPGFMVDFLALFFVYGMFSQWPCLMRNLDFITKLLVWFLKLSHACDSVLFRAGRSYNLLSEFVIAPVKWPYYFWATAKIYQAPYRRFPMFAAFWFSACMLTKTLMKKSN